MPTRRRKTPPPIQQLPAAPRELPLLEAIKVARVFCVPVQFVLGEDMYNQWRRRTKRLHRAAVNASPERRAAIYAALRRLSTGSMQ